MCSGRTPRVTASPTFSPSAWTGTVIGVPPGRVTVAVPPSTAGDRRLHEVHLRRADEAGDEQVGRMVVELERGADLLDDAALQHHDLVGQGHRLDLIVGHVDHGGVEIVMQLGDLDAHLHAQRGVEIRQRLVEEEDLGVAHNGAADGDTLALAAGELLGLALQQSVELEDAGRVADLLVDALLALLRQLPGRRPCSLPPSYAGRGRRTGTPWRCRAGPAAGR